MGLFSCGCARVDLWWQIVMQFRCISHIPSSLEFNHNCSLSWILTHPLLSLSLSLTPNSLFLSWTLVPILQLCSTLSLYPSNLAVMTCICITFKSVEISIKKSFSKKFFLRRKLENIWEYSPFFWHWIPSLAPSPPPPPPPQKKKLKKKIKKKKEWKKKKKKK
jgi:hypothetical protein